MRTTVFLLNKKSRITLPSCSKTSSKNFSPSFLGQFLWYPSSYHNSTRKAQLFKVYSGQTDLNQTASFGRSLAWPRTQYSKIQNSASVKLYINLCQSSVLSETCTRLSFEKDSGISALKRAKCTQICPQRNHLQNSPQLKQGNTKPSVALLSHSL